MLSCELDKCNFGFFTKHDLSTNKSGNHSGGVTTYNHWQQEHQVQPMIANDDDKGTKATFLCLVLSFVCVSWPLTII